MNREEKIDAIIEFLDENNIKIIETGNIGAVIIEADFGLNKEQDVDEYKGLLEKGLTEKQIEEFKTFLDDSGLLMISIDDIQGVSFENLEYYIDDLGESDLWSDEEEKEEKE